jgi:GGDEF domain-containing protein
LQRLPSGRDSRLGLAVVQVTELVLTHGFDCIPHLVAQVVLEELARLLQEIIRTGRIRPLDGVAARVGGDDDGLGSG